MFQKHESNTSEAYIKSAKETISKKHEPFLRATCRWNTDKGPVSYYSINQLKNIQTLERTAKSVLAITARTVVSLLQTSRQNWRLSRGLANLNQLILASPTTGIHPFKTLCIFKIFFPEKQIEKAEVNKLISSVVHVKHCYSNWRHCK